MQGPRLSAPFTRRWQALALSAAAGLSLGLATLDAHALALGRLTVQSALGEPLRAEIDVPQITPEEAASLQATLASAEAFRAAGMERSAALNDLRITLQQRAGDGYVLRLTSERGMSEPFVDLIIEANWSAGRIVRDYTMLFDPPALRAATPPPAPQAAQVAPPAAETTARPGAVAAAPAPAAAPSPAAGSAAGRRVTVNAGETAGRLAAANKPPTVSLDQMLVAMLRANPNAFVGGNVNRLRAGAVVELPTAEQAQAVEAPQARQTVVAQSRDFNEFRRRLAESSGLAAPEAGPAKREAAGKVEARVEEKAPAGAAPDKLRLSKGSVQGATSEDRLARDRDARDAASRVAELERNIAELNRLGAASGPAGAPAAAASRGASGAGLAVATTPAVPASAASEAIASSASAPASAAASAPAAPASEPASAPAVPASTPASAGKRAASAPTAAAGSGLLTTLKDEPLLPIAAGGALALLLGLLLWRRRSAAQGQGQVDSSFLESKLQPDSFFGGSGGQRIDTAEGGPLTGNSMVYSPSQIDAAGDVDPVAEADVYLAYGRDLQAEEILKEALRINPQRVAIIAKLLEIHARRGDTRAFEPLARQAHALTRGSGPEWNHIAAMGRDLLPDEPMFEQDDEGNTAALAESLDNPETEPIASVQEASALLEPEPDTPPSAPLQPAPPVDIDLGEIDLDLVTPEPQAPPRSRRPHRPRPSPSCTSNPWTSPPISPPRTLKQPPRPTRLRPPCRPAWTWTWPPSPCPAPASLRLPATRWTSTPRSTCRWPRPARPCLRPPQPPRPCRTT